MARESLIFICASLILTQFVVVNADKDDIDWTTIHDELRKLAGNLRKKCMSETGASNDMLEAAELGEFPSPDLPVACYFKCMLEKAGVMKKDGKINYKILSKLFPEAYKDIATKMLDQCRTIGKYQFLEIIILIMM